LKTQGTGVTTIGFSEEEQFGREKFLIEEVTGGKKLA